MHQYNVGYLAVHESRDAIRFVCLVMERHITQRGGAVYGTKVSIPRCLFAAKNPRQKLGLTMIVSL
jgi:hypothetical protein